MYKRCLGHRNGKEYLKEFKREIGGGNGQIWLYQTKMQEKQCDAFRRRKNSHQLYKRVTYSESSVIAIAVSRSPGTKPLGRGVRRNTRTRVHGGQQENTLCRGCFWCLDWESLKSCSPSSSWSINKDPSGQWTRWNRRDFQFSHRQASRCRRGERIHHASEKEASAMWDPVWSGHWLLP